MAEVAERQERAHYPDVEVHVETHEQPQTDGEADFPRRIFVDGQLWPVLGFTYEITNERHGAVITLKVRGKVRIVEDE